MDINIVAIVVIILVVCCKLYSDAIQFALSREIDISLYMYRPSRSMRSNRVVTLNGLVISMARRFTQTEKNMTITVKVIYNNSAVISVRKVIFQTTIRYIV